METESTALGFRWFYRLIHCRLVEKEEIQTNFTPVSADTRINIKLKSDTETEINGLGPLTNEEIQELKQAVSRVQAGDIVVLSGSTRFSTQRILRKLIQIVKEKGAEFVIDTTGEDLMNALSQSLYWSSQIIMSWQNYIIQPLQVLKIFYLMDIGY